VQPTMHRHANEPGDLGERLLALAENMGAELLVMGCYGRGRTRELVLGGVTRTVLKSMSLPVLMAH
jgi:nucleotide-binding universal stress UspA family protein